MALSLRNIDTAILQHFWQALEQPARTKILSIPACTAPIAQLLVEMRSDTAQLGETPLRLVHNGGDLAELSSWEVRMHPSFLQRDDGPLELKRLGAGAIQASSRLRNAQTMKGLVMRARTWAQKVSVVFLLLSFRFEEHCAHHPLPMLCQPELHELEEPVRRKRKPRRRRSRPPVNAPTERRPLAPLQPPCCTSFHVCVSRTLICAVRATRLKTERSRSLPIREPQPCCCIYCDE